MTEKIVAVVRLRGKADTHHIMKKTLSLLRLHKVNHAAVYPESPSLKGMLFKIKDRVTWGEISKEDFVYLLKKRGELYGKNNKLTDEHLQANTEFASIEAFADAFFEGKAKLTDIPGVQPVFRLNPPRKGFKSLKNPINRGGDLGYRGEAMSTLLRRMA